MKIRELFSLTKSNHNLYELAISKKNKNLSRRSHQYWSARDLRRECRPAWSFDIGQPGPDPTSIPECPAPGFRIGRNFPNAIAIVLRICWTWFLPSPF